MNTTVSLLSFLGPATRGSNHRPWPRFEVNEAGWRSLLTQLVGTDWSLLGLWGEPGQVHLALRDDINGEIAAVSLRCPEGRFASVAGVRPAAQRLERAVHDLFGLVPEESQDTRPWLDHGGWGVHQPLAAPAPAVPARASAYPFLPVEGDGLHEIPVGPVHAGIIEPGHFHFHANGETVVRLEQRLGYAHKGIEALAAGKTVDAAAKLAARVSGDSTVAHSLAFAQAIEAALDAAAPPRAAWLRAVMAELERIANHFGDIGAICNDAAFAFIHAHCAILREQTLRLAESCFGHRLMMDVVVPGGVACDLAAAGGDAIRAFIAAARPRFARLVRVYDNKASLADRTVGTGATAANLVHRFGAGGYVGRAASRDFDARRSPGYAPYDQLEFAVPVLHEGDVNARVWIRIKEIEESFGLLTQMLERLPDGAVRTSLPPGAGEGMALVEGFRGEILAWVRVSHGEVLRYHPRDPSWLQWPLLEAAIEGNIVADFPLCNKSFNCSYSGHDL